MAEPRQDHTHSPLDPIDANGWTPRALPTGLTHLDEIISGLSPGEVCVVTAAPGQGRSTLMAQLAGKLAGDHEVPTWLTSNRDPAPVVAGRIHAAAATVALSHIATGRIIDDERRRLAQSRERLESAPLTVVDGRFAAQRAGPFLEAQARKSPIAVLMDDPSWDGDWELRDARTLAASGAIVVVSLPRRRIIDGIAFRADLKPETESADLVLEVRLHDFPKAGLDSHLEQPGTAAITILRNRRGPSLSFVVGFQGHFARFIDLGEADNSRIY